MRNVKWNITYHSYLRYMRGKDKVPYEGSYFHKICQEIKLIIIKFGSYFNILFLVRRVRLCFQVMCSSIHKKISQNLEILYP